MTLTDVKYNHRDGAKYDKILVFLHGLGSNCQDLISLAPELANACPGKNFLFTSVNAPQKYDFSDSGYQWFSLKDWDEARIYREIVESCKILRQYLDELLEKYNSSYENLFLAGFSQGAMIGLHVAPRFEEKIAGVIALSGRLILPEKLGLEAKSRPAIMLNHGREDDIVPFHFMESAKKTLEDNNFPVEAHHNKIGHTIDFVCLEKMKLFLKNHS